MNIENVNQGIKYELHKTVKVIPVRIDNANQTEEMRKRRVCAYCRVSTTEETQQGSYKLQVKHYKNLIKSNNLRKFSGIYADEGISGTSTKNRKDFQRMIEDCRAGKIDLIITKSVSRFSRNTLDSLFYTRMLKDLPSPVEIYFEKEGIETLDAKSELYLTIMASIAQDESKNLSENMLWSIQKRYQAGIAFWPLKHFMGYKEDKGGNAVIDEEQAETIRRIYREYINGFGTTVIAKRLTAESILTGKGKTVWAASTVHGILRNEKYCGDVIMQKRVTIDFLEHKTAPNHGELPVYYVADHHPGIISREDWDAVQILLNQSSKRLQLNKIGTAEDAGMLVLSNILYCGNCGEPFIRRTRTSTRMNKKHSYPIWKCRTADGRISGSYCHAKSYREESIENAFMHMILDIKQNKTSFIKKAKRAINKSNLNKWERERMVNLDSEIKFLEDKLIQVLDSDSIGSEADITNGIDLYLKQEIEDLQNEKHELKEKKNMALEKSNTLNWLLEELNNIDEVETDNNHIEFRKDIFKRVVKRGTVYNDGSIIYEFVFETTKKSTIK